MTALTLFDNPASSNALKVRVLLAELGLAYERHEVALSHPRPGDYLALNPLGTVPALRDGDLLLTESQAILRYLATREGREDLYPTADLRERAVVDELLDRWATTFRPLFFSVEIPVIGWTPEGGALSAPQDMSKVPEAAAKVAPKLAILDGLVGERFAVLGRFTIADCALMPILFRTTKTGHPLDAFPRLSALREAYLAHPALHAAEPVF